MSSLHDTKRRESAPLEAVQAGNRSWWTEQTMSYDWKSKIAAPRFSSAWFNESDARFIEAAKLFGHDQQPFDRIIPFSQLTGKRVLEIGCGMGLHTELMARAGANVTAIDISPTSVDATRKRLELKGVDATVIQADAETLQLPARSFDFVWSWGVIHHSAHTGRIVRTVARLLTPSGQFRVMVYNRDSFIARYMLVRKYWLGGAFRTKSYDEVLYQASDGYSARFYPPEQFADLLRTFFHDVEYEVMGQFADALPLPRRLRALLAPWISQQWAQRRQRRWGAFIFATAKNVLDQELDHVAA